MLSCFYLYFFHNIFFHVLIGHCISSFINFQFMSLAHFFLKAVHSSNIIRVSITICNACFRCFSGFVIYFKILVEKFTKIFNILHGQIQQSCAL